MYFKFMASNRLAAFINELRERFPLELRNEIGHRLSFNIGLQTHQASHGLIKIKDAAVFIHHENSIFDCVEKSLKECSFASQPLDHILESLCIQPGYAPE